MLHTLRMIKMVALFFFLSGFATPFNENLNQVMNNLERDGKRLSLVLVKQNNVLAKEAQLLSKKISAIKAGLNNTLKRYLTPTDINSLCLNYGELYQKASSQTEIFKTSSRQILINIKGHINALLIANR